jgi:hypothetical protein
MLIALRENSTQSGDLPPLRTPCVLIFWGKVQGRIPSCAPSPQAFLPNLTPLHEGRQGLSLTGSRKYNHLI